MDKVTRPFWGRAAVMEVMSESGFILKRDSIKFPEKGVPLVQYLNGGDVVGPSAILGHVKNIWYGDESGLQVILFDGEWTESAYPEDLYSEVDKFFTPSLFVDRAQWLVETNGTVIDYGELRSVMLSVLPAWNGLFIKSEPLPEGLRNRGRII